MEGELLFGKYRILGTLGEGGTSIVYLAENIKLGNKWAIKKAYKNQSDISLQAEPKLLIKLNHRAIPKIVDIEEDEEAIYIIEEYVEGINLKAYKFKDSNIDEAIIIDWAIQICDILIYLHQLEPHPIIFRDIKPENIIISSESKLYLVDFGISREFKESSNNDTIPIGTRGYAAPEQYGIGQSDGRTDIFSLGITLHYLLTERNLSHPPYKITTVRAYYDEVSEDLENIVLKCCEILPSNRYQTAIELKQALMNLEGLSTQNTEQLEVVSNFSSNKINNKHEKINIRKTITMGFIGVSSKVGVTHTALMLSTYLSQKHKVAVVEMNASGHIFDICGLDREDTTDEMHFSRYKKVDYYFNLSLSTFVGRYREKYDYVLVDFGSYEEIFDFDDFIRADIRFAIGQGIDWKVKEINGFYNNTKYLDISHSWIYLVPFMDKKNTNDVRALFRNKVYNVPFNMNPFKVSRETNKIFSKIMYGR